VSGSCCIFALQSIWLKSQLQYSTRPVRLKAFSFLCHPALEMKGVDGRESGTRIIAFWPVIDSCFETSFKLNASTVFRLCVRRYLAAFGLIDYLKPHLTALTFPLTRSTSPPTARKAQKSNVKCEMSNVAKKTLFAMDESIDWKTAHAPSPKLRWVSCRYRSSSWPEEKNRIHI
jgi:hypothetical protein